MVCSQSLVHTHEILTGPFMTLFLSQCRSRLVSNTCFFALWQCLVALKVRRYLPSLSSYIFEISVLCNEKKMLSSLSSLNTKLRSSSEMNKLILPQPGNLSGLGVQFRGARQEKPPHLQKHTF